MSENLEITDIQMVKENKVQRSAVAGATERTWLQFSIVLMNHSAERGYYFVSRMGTLAYDSSTHSLHLGFDRVELTEAGRSTRATPLLQGFVEPNGSEVLHASVPSVFKRVVPTTHLSIHHEMVDLQPCQLVHGVHSATKPGLRHSGVDHDVGVGFISGLGFGVGTFRDIHQEVAGKAGEAHHSAALWSGLVRAV